MPDRVDQLMFSLGSAPSTGRSPLRAHRTKGVVPLEPRGFQDPDASSPAFPFTPADVASGITQSS